MTPASTICLDRLRGYFDQCYTQSGLTKRTGIYEETMPAVKLSNSGMFVAMMSITERMVPRLARGRSF